METKLEPFHTNKYGTIFKDSNGTEIDRKEGEYRKAGEVKGGW
jgi:hypothetical protein